MDTTAAVPPDTVPTRPGSATSIAPVRHNLMSLRRLFWLRWALMGGQSVLLVSCESVAGVILPYSPLLAILSLQAVFNLLTGLRLRMHTGRGGMPSDAELMGQLKVDLTALSA